MKSLRTWRLMLLSVLFLQLVLFSALTLANEPITDIDTEPTIDIAEPIDPIHTEQAPLVDNAPKTRWNAHDGTGSEESIVAVQKALALLKAVEFQDGLTKYERPTGILGNAWYYSRQVFRLLFMNGPTLEDTSGEKKNYRISKPVAKSVELLRSAADEKNADAIFLLAEMNFYGNFTHPRDYAEAFRRYKDLAALTGNSTAQHMLGFMYATGVGGSVERDQAKALVYHTFAADGGDIRSEMTLAFRYHTGIAMPKSCDDAAHYYKRVADQVVEYARSGPPGGQSMFAESYRWADEDGGIYGEGASVSSSGPHANRGGPNSHGNIDDVLEYLDLMSKKGDLRSTINLGELYYEGTRQLKRSVKTSMKYFTQVARKYWGKDGKVITNGPYGIEKLASKAAAYIGRIYLRGEGVEQNFEKALTWFKRGLANGDSLCQHHLGLMYLHGLGVPQDAMRAASFFNAAAEDDLAASQKELGALFLDQGDINNAIRYFELAARHGHMEAFYYLAEIANQGLGKERQCGVATAYYKIVAEKAEAVHATYIKEANEAYKNGDFETALVNTMMAAEQGYESAQSNVAYLLDEQKSVLPLGKLLPWKQNETPFFKNPVLALIYWTRSAKQNNYDSLVKMGDYYLNGLGSEADADKASACYSAAAEGQRSAQALWNLGWMHENGIAVEKDFHMAKRFYDLSLETAQEAYLPVKLSLFKLRAKSWWNQVTGGKVNSIQPEPENRKRRTFSEWITDFLEYDEDYEGHDHYADNTDDIGYDEGDPMPGGDDSYYDDLELDIDEGLLESMIIIGLAATLAFLVYYRQQRNMRGEDNQNGNAGNEHAAVGAGAANNPGARPGENGDRGMFPGPDDPDYPRWIAGAVGN